jgi:hypothetical protein
MVVVWKKSASLSRFLESLGDLVRLIKLASSSGFLTMRSTDNPGDQLRAPCSASRAVVDESTLDGKDKSINDSRSTHMIPCSFRPGREPRSASERDLESVCVHVVQSVAWVAHVGRVVHGRRTKPMTPLAPAQNRANEPKDAPGTDPESRERTVMSLRLNPPHENGARLRACLI